MNTNNIQQESTFQFLKIRRSLLFSKVTIFSAIVALIHTVEDSFGGEIIIPICNFFIALLLFGCYIGNKKGHYGKSVFTLLFALNVGFFFYSLVLPNEDGLFLYYIPLIILAFILHGKEYKSRRYFFTGLSLFALTILFIADFSLFGIEKLNPVNTQLSFVINVFSCFLITIFCVDFMLRLNEKAESILDDMAKELGTKNSSLEKANEELDRFLYSTSHDMRSPLLSIKGLINLSLMENDKAVIHSYLDKMNGRIDWLDTFVKEIMNYSRNIKSEVNHEEVQLSQMIEEAVEGLRFMDEAKKIRFDLHLEAKCVVTDKRRLEIVIYNLISNAIKYHDLTKSDPWIKISTRAYGKKWVLHVEDNGQGIEKEYQDRIFNMFFRGTEKSTGSGLGLYIVKEIITKLDGKISVQSVKNQGTEFSLHFTDNINYTNMSVQQPESKELVLTDFNSLSPQAQAS